MEWVFVVALVVALGAKVWLARSGYRRRRQQGRRHLEAGDVPRRAPDHLPGRGSGG
jgi:hypothetical protein